MLVLASTSGWYLWVGIGGLVVLVVVLLVLTIYVYVSRIAAQAADGSRAMLEATSNTMSVWKLRDINRSTTGIWRAAESARKVLGG